MWLFLATEVMFFGGLFASYTIFRSRYDLAFIEASHHLNVALGSINTVILLASSFTMALAVRSAQLARRRALVIAFTKATLVALFFMHRRWSPALQRIVGVAALFWLAILIALTLSDYLTRGWIPVPGSWESSMNFTRDFMASLTGRG